MTSRNRTAQFLRLRDSFRKMTRVYHSKSWECELQTVDTSRGGRNKSDKQDKQRLLASSSRDLESGHTNVAAPKWVRLTEDTQVDLSSARQLLGDLQRLHGAHLKVGFDDSSSAATGADVERVATEVQRLLVRSGERVKSLGAGTNSSTKQRGTEAADLLMRKNAATALATQLHGVTSEFRKLQQQYMRRLRGQEAATVGYSASSDPHTDTVSTSSMMRVEYAEQESAARSKEIAAVANSMEQLAGVFREMSLLVVEQGSVVDRIDYNVEKTLEHTRAAHEQLVKADRYQRRGTLTCCMVLLTVLVGIVALLLVLKIMGTINI